MASLKACVKKDVVNSDHKANIKIRVSHHRLGDKKAKVRYIKTSHYIDPRHMGDDGVIKPSYGGQASLNKSLAVLLLEYNTILAEIGPDVNHMDINDVVKRLSAHSIFGSSFSLYMEKRIKDLKREGRFSYAESCQVTLDHLEKHTGRNDIGFREITVPFLNDFKGYLTNSRRLRINSVRIYLNNIRSIYFHALDNEIIKEQGNPFRKFRIEQEKTRPRPLDVSELRLLLTLRDKVTTQQRKAIDIFFLSFYTCGTNLKDLLYLKPGRVVRGRIEYERFKTGRTYSIKIFPQAQQLLDLYKGEKYLLSFMDEKEKISPRRMDEAHHDILSQTNKLLKKIKKDHDLPFHLSTYDARYSWATIAARIGISKDVISHALGHGLDTMTDIYIDFDLSKVDRANQKVIKYLTL